MVTGVTTSVQDRVVPERVVNVEEFRTIGIVQMFERLGWERVLDWCEDNTPRICLTAVCEWLASLRFINKDGLPSTWKLDGLYFDNKTNMDDPEGMIRSVLPYSDGGAPLKSHLSVEGKILQGISLENIMERFGDHGKVKAPDCRVIHALLFGSPTLSCRHIVMMNTWDTREVCTRRIIPYARWISAMTLHLASRKRHWKIQVQVYGHQYTVTNDLGHKYQFTDPSAAQEAVGDEEMLDEEDDDEPASPRGPRQRYYRPHQEIFGV
ncbi:hypothetical protein Hanom_Chr06g00557331 [Helianthus anomalus]